MNISPNRRVPGEIVFEPVLNGVRVTARDSQHRVLWGFIGSAEMLRQVHCPVAVYETLQELLEEELGRSGLPKRETSDPMEAARGALNRLHGTLENLEASITVKKVSDATRDRAMMIARIASDAHRMICLEIPGAQGVEETIDPQQ